MSLDKTQSMTNAVAGLQFFCGHDLNSVVTTPNVLAFGFYLNRQIWVVVDLDSQKPVVCVRSGSLPIKNKQTPVKLFLEAHFEKKNLTTVQVKQGFGRVLEMNFGDEHQIEIRLFPRGQNVLVRAEKKSIAWNKPHDLKEAELREPTNATSDDDALIELIQLGDQWCERFESKQKNDVKSQTGNKSAESLKTEKLEKALIKLKAETEKIAPYIWFEAGEFLKSNSLDLAKEKFPEQVNDRVGLSDNLKKIFETAKAKEAKRDRAMARVRELEKQIQDSKLIPLQGDIEPAEPIAKQNSDAESILKNAGAKGRTFLLNEKNVFFVGKSASDNMALLRRAKPWHLWLHLKDYPGCHGILMRNKTENIADAVLVQAAQHLLEKQWGAKAKERRGDVFDFLVAECRRVKPLKGDKMGRVTHTHSRTLAVRMLQVVLLVLFGLGSWSGFRFESNTAQAAQTISVNQGNQSPQNQKSKGDRSKQNQSENAKSETAQSAITSDATPGTNPATQKEGAIDGLSDETLGESDEDIQFASDSTSRKPTEQSSQSQFGIRPQIETQYPYFLGAGAVVEIFQSFELGGSVGYTPQSYAKTIGGFVAEYGGEEAYDDLIQAAFEDNSSARLMLAYNFGNDVQGWRIQTAMTWMKAEGDAEIDEVLGAVTGRDFSALKSLLVAAGKPTSVDLESEISVAELSVGYGWQLADHILLTANAGVISVLEADMKIKTGLPAFESSNAGQTLLRESEAELEEIVKENGVSPLLGLALAYRF
jgi:hypothetical protein